ncbi:MAG: nicotinate phosphoribosyltransferase [Candidatus Omnitrophota bacterium]
MTKENQTANLSLLTDLYELTMAASYFKHKRGCLASFDLFIRNLPEQRSFFLAAGLADIISFLAKFRFDGDSIRYLKSLGIFSSEFLEFLKNLRFRGSLWAVPEGTVVFPNEPLIRIVAPIIEGQLLESYLLNTINLQTTIATKAVRVVTAAKGKSVFDFSLRRTHGADAGLKAARSSYIAGFQGTSNVLAGKLYGIPVVGTMAHSFVMAFKNELDSFFAFAETFGHQAILLVDTYDTMQGVKNAIIVAKALEKKGKRLKAIRLDSGNLIQLACQARRLLDQASLNYVKIFASGNLDEYKIKELIALKAPIDSFGVGTKMGVSVDAPYCDVIYKLSEITDVNGEFLPTMKLSEGKSTYPGRKQVYRQLNKKGHYKKDIIALENEPIDGKKLLVKVIDNGICVYRQPSLGEIRKRAKENLSKLPIQVKKLAHSSPYQVDVSPNLQKLIWQVKKNIVRGK